MKPFRWLFSALLCIPHLAMAEGASQTPIVFIRSPMEIRVAVPEPKAEEKTEEVKGERRPPAGNQVITHTFAAEVRYVVAGQKEYTVDLKTHTERSGILWVYAAERPAELDTALLTDEADVLALGKSGQIQQVLPGVAPEAEDIAPFGKAPYALVFLKAGSAARLGVKPGDRVIHRVFKGGTLTEQMVDGQSNAQAGPVIFRSR